MIFCGMFAQHAISVRGGCGFERDQSHTKFPARRKLMQVSPAKPLGSANRHPPRERRRIRRFGWRVDIRNGFARFSRGQRPSFVAGPNAHLTTVRHAPDSAVPLTACGFRSGAETGKASMSNHWGTKVLMARLCLNRQLIRLHQTPRAMALRHPSDRCAP